MTKLRRHAALCIAYSAGALLVAGCQGKPEADGGGITVASVGEAHISASQVEAKLNEYVPVVRARFKALEKKKELLDGMVRFELLRQEALRRGLDKDPEVIEAAERAAVQRLLKAETDEYDRAHPLSNAELQKYFQDHLSEFVRPQRVRAAHVFFAAPKNDARRAQVMAEAEKARASLRSNTGTDAFADLARSRSNDLVTRSLGGDLSYRSKEELAELWGAPVAEAAFALAAEQLSPIVTTDRGFHLVKVLGRQNGIEQSFEEVKAKIESRLAAERRSRRLDELVARLKSQAEVRIDDKALNAVAVQDR